MICTQGFASTLLGLRTRSTLRGGRRIGFLPGDMVQDGLDGRLSRVVARPNDACIGLRDPSSFLGSLKVFEVTCDGAILSVLLDVRPPFAKSALDLPRLVPD